MEVRFLACVDTIRVNAIRVKCMIPAFCVYVAVQSHPAQGPPPSLRTFLK